MVAEVGTLCSSRALATLSRLEEVAHGVHREWCPLMSHGITRFCTDVSTLVVDTQYKIGTMNE